MPNRPAQVWLRGSINSWLPSSLPSLGCVTLIAVPFAAIGAMVAYLTLHTLLRIVIVQGWPTVPATIQAVELQSAGSTAEKVVTSYTYVIQGKTYTGHRVSLYGPDNLGSFHRNAYNLLHSYLARQAPYPAHVNPKAPAESMLMPVLRWEAIGFYLVFVVVFGGPGWGIIVSSCLRLLQARQESVLFARYPDEPWKQRVVWSKPEIKSSQAHDAILEICVAVFWNVATFPVLLVIPRELAAGHYFALTFLLIPLIGAGLACWALVAVARAVRFARTYLRLDVIPGRPGQTLRGHIRAPRALATASEVALSLRCERTFGARSANGGSSLGQSGNSGAEDIWRYDSFTPVVSGPSPSGEVLLAVAIDLPTGYPDSWRGPGDQFAWLLSANAHLAGADFIVEFEVPVFSV